MKQRRFPLICGVRLEPAEAQFLDRIARQNDRTRSAELRRMLRERMQAEAVKPHLSSMVSDWGKLS